MSDTTTLDNIVYDPVTSEAEVRKYLDFLADPSSIVDEEAIAAKQEEMDNEEDALTRLELHAELIDLQNPDSDEVEAGFVRSAKAVAEAKGFGVESYQQMYRIPANLLSEAGFEPVAVKNGTRKTRVSADKIAQALENTEGPFTVHDIIDATHASDAAVRNVIHSFVETGTVVEKGLDPDHEGRGRAPMMYERS